MIVSIDTSGKMGRILKSVTIYSNDPVSPTKIVRLTAEIIDTNHPSGIVGKKIFDKSCARCHVDRGEGNYGKALFIADCSMCHSLTTQRKSASSIWQLRILTEDMLRSRISNGYPGFIMPGFYKAVGGPLDDKQIESLIRFIKAKD